MEYALIVVQTAVIAKSARQKKIICVYYI